jgi:uncharacterized membrane protein HdeD (DUF308 family)
MSNLRKNQIRIAWWAMRITVYVFLGFYFTFDSTNYPHKVTDIIGIGLLILGIVDTFFLFKGLKPKEK